MIGTVLGIFRLNSALLDVGNHITKLYGLTRAQQIVNDLLKIKMVAPDTNIDHKPAPLISITDKRRKIMTKINQGQIVWINQLSKGTSGKQLTKTLELSLQCENVLSNLIQKWKNKRC